MAGSQQNAGAGGGSSSLMDLISADPVAPSPAPSSASSGSGGGFTAGRRSFKKSSLPNLLQLPGDGLLSPSKILPSPVKTIAPKQKKPLSYSQLARSLHELAATSDQKAPQRQLVNHVFPKLAVYSSVDPSLAPSLIMLHQQADDRQVLRYVYYFLSRILGEADSHGVVPGGGIPTPNWDALADMSVAGGVTRADVVPRIIELLAAEASTPDPAVHPRRIAALKALTCASTNEDVVTKLYEIVFGILDKVADAGKIRKKRGMFGRQTLDRESALRSNLQYAALSALQKLPIDQGNPAFLHRAVQGIACADPVGVRHALAMVSEMAPRDPYGVAMAVAKLSLAGGSLQEVLQIHDVMARVYLARLCYVLSRARVLDEVPDLRSQFTTILYQLLLDPSERVCFEAISCILGKFSNTESSAERANGWTVLASAILRFPDTSFNPLKDNSPIKDGGSQDGQPAKLPRDRTMPRPRRPQALIKLVMRRLESALRSHSRPVLHAAARIIMEIGRSRAAAFTHGVSVNEDSYPESFIENGLTEDVGDAEGGRSKVSSLSSARETISSMLSSLMEAVRTTVACECVYVRAAAIKAMIWMQRPDESVEELKSIIAGELSDPSWPASLLSDILLTLHARFKATPDMAVILLDISRLFATKVPGKIDADVLQLLWKTCLVGCGPTGKHTALEAVTIVLDLPPPAPVVMKSSSLLDRISAFDPKAATALLRLVQAAVWFLGENANYAAAEYAWESKTPPGTALMMLDGDKMVAAASSRNPTLAGALTRLQRCASSGSWEVRIVAAQALITIAIRSGEPYRLQIYEFLDALAKGHALDKFSDLHVSNGEDQGASGTGLSSILAPMLRVLDEMYKAQDQLIKDMRQHDNAKQEWSDDELRVLYETHERLLDLVSLFCFVPRSKYLPLGPTSANLIDIYCKRHHIDVATGYNDPAVATGIADLLPYAGAQPEYPPVQIEEDKPNVSDTLWTPSPRAADLVNDFLGGKGTDAPEVEENPTARQSISYDDMWAKTLLEASDDETVDDRSSGSSSPESTASFETSASSRYGSTRYPSLFNNPTAPGFGQQQRWEEPRPEPSTLSSLNEDEPSRSEEESWQSRFGRQDSFSSENPSHASLQDGTQSGRALYDFTAGGDEELSIVSGEDLEIEYEVDGWYHVRKKKPGRDGKISGLVPVLYIGS
ncbi:uncharacterized protein LOC9633241 [Selaginella moellendorffii]|uniref:uncharacterized protein LOC9633241 n=1 Tax=Selaginella moellendorffii TaxID=88036 RepID=UPI000D1D120C|nr:uncharacterized protein LOC9633241 [Selaginella moellendorffii]|eukprot:XP_024525120.1 uncharacterized protein LOC9633241 [Selaginella moellendorffii]